MDNELTITIVVRIYNGKLGYIFYIGGEMCKNAVNNLIGSSVLEEAIERSKKGLLKYISET